MKKISLLLLAIALLSGCTKQASMDITDPKEVVFTINGENIYKETLYDVMKSYEVGDIIVNDAQKYIIDKEISEITEEMQSKIDEQIDLYMGAFGEEGFASQFGDVETFTNENLLPSLKYDALLDKYVDENIGHLASVYKPVKLQTMEFLDQETADAALASLKQGVSFEKVATDNDFEDKGAPKVESLKNATYPVEVKLFIDEAEGAKLSDVILDEENSKYYIVNVISIDYNDYVEEASATIVAIPEAVTDIIAYYFNKYNFEVYTPELRDEIKLSRPELID